MLHRWSESLDNSKDCRELLKETPCSLKISIGLEKR